MSYYHELYENAKQLHERFGNNLDLLFSGGIDSEVVLRVYTILKLPINVHIFKYENDLNIREFTQATKICQELGITPHVRNFNVKKFFENDAESIFKKVYCNSSGWLPHMKMTEELDGIPVFGSGDPYWKRLSTDWTRPSEWLFEIDEGAKAWSIYHKTIGRDAICDWYEYSPEIILSHMKLPRIKNLISDKIKGKLSSFSHKALIHQDIWPTVDIRPKMVGFEGHSKPDKKSKPGYMLEFEKEFIENKVHSKILHYKIDQVLDLFG